MFDGNWWRNNEQDSDDEEALRHFLDKVEENHKDYIEDMEYEEDIADSYNKL